MIKKKTALLPLILAYSILLGHNLIPHHHHETDHHLTEHHEAEQHHNHGHEEDELNNLYSNFFHSPHSLVFTYSHSFNHSFFKKIFLYTPVLIDNFFSCEFLIPPLLQHPPGKHFIYSSPHTLSSGLRAPPAFKG